MMALTATASHSLQFQLIDIIGMNKPVLIVLSPCKPNKVSAYNSIIDNFTPLLERLRKERLHFH